VKDPRGGQHHCEVEAREGYLFVRQSGVLDSVAEAQRVQQKVERALRQHDMRLVMFDNRRTGEPAAQARESMWDWCRECPFVERVALLLESDLTLVRANMTALGKRTQLRSFSDEKLAAEWLLKRRTADTAAQS
jgi:hypothetical protein